jgi:GT2 family glycosyltransferase
MVVATRPPPALAVIVPCLGQAAELEDCLRGLEGQTGGVPFETVVVDSAWDEAVAGAAARFPQVKLVRSGDRLSAGAARNLGVRNSTAPELAFIDADCVPAAAWVREAAGALLAGGRLCGGPVLDWAGDHPVAWADNHLQFADFQAGRPAGPAGYFPGCNMVVRREDFSALGGFNEEHVSGEDVLFALLAGEKFPGGLVFKPRMIVRHRGRMRWKPFLDHQRLLGYRRSYSRLHLNPGYEWLARHKILAGLVVLRRFGYISLRTIQYDRPGLVRLVLFLPWLLAGLAAWAGGFYDGYHINDREP